MFFVRVELVQLVLRLQLTEQDLYFPATPVQCRGVRQEPLTREIRDVYAFDDTLLVVDVDRVDIADCAELVTSAARDTESIYRAARARIQIAGHSYQVNLPPAEDAGFDEGDTAPVHPAPGVLVITTDEVEASRLAADLVMIRHSRVST